MPHRNRSRDNTHRPRTYANTSFWRRRFYILTKNKNIAILFQSIANARYDNDLLRVSKHSKKFQPFQP